MKPHRRSARRSTPRDYSDSQVIIRLTEKEKALWIERAERLFLTLSDYVRGTVAEELRCNDARDPRRRNVAIAR
jgi:hypothetical protein